MARIAILVCHLSGTGHLVRTLRLARAAVAAGHEVLVISGGRPLDHVDQMGVAVAELPPVTVQGLDFSTLVTPDGVAATEAYLKKREDQIRQNIKTFAPDVLITELFPLGRRMLSNEFLAAIDATPRALILSSVRDVPEPKPKRLDQTADRLRARYDGVLVHGDESIMPLSATWPLPEDVMQMVHYTGYVAPPRPAAQPPGKDILVSTGGGNLGRFLVEVAARAATLSSNPWHVLVGGADAAEIARAVLPAPNLTIEPARRDYPDLLASAACSVSLSGYNTAVELAALETPAILVPSEEGGEREQLLRAIALAHHGGIDVVREHELTSEDLAKRADALAAGPRRAPVPLQMDQGEGAVAVIEALLAVRG